MIQDFFGVEPDGQLAVKARLVLPDGGELLLRPLSLEKLFALMQIGMPNISMEEVADLSVEKFMSAFSESFGPALAIATGVDVSVLQFEAVTQAVIWYIGEHDWPRIYEEILCPDGQPAPPEVAANSVLDLMLAVEIATQGARPIERQLRMRPEAWISCLASMERRAERLKKGMEDPGVSGSGLNAKGISVEQLFSILPGGETVNVVLEKSEESGQGGH